jgi:hypothetical protein
MTILSQIIERILRCYISIEKKFNLFRNKEIKLPCAYNLLFLVKKTIKKKNMNNNQEIKQLSIPTIKYDDETGIICNVTKLELKDSLPIIHVKENNETAIYSLPN